MASRRRVDTTMAETLTPAGYRPRVADAAVARALAAMPAVVIEGPKGCGKTWTGCNFARSEVLFDRDLNARRSVSVVPGLVLDGEEPRLLDEWQLAPEVWNQVRRASDDGHGTGRFILTGSAVPPDDITRHSGAGRIARVRMRPMSLLETGESTGEVSLHCFRELRSLPGVRKRSSQTCSTLCAGVAGPACWASRCRARSSSWTTIWRSSVAPTSPQSMGWHATRPAWRGWSLRRPQRRHHSLVLEARRTPRAKPHDGHRVPGRWSGCS